MGEKLSYIHFNDRKVLHIETCSFDTLQIELWDEKKGRIYIGISSIELDKLINYFERVKQLKDNKEE